MIISGRHTPLDYLFFLRPVLLPPVWTIALLGTVRSGLPHEMPVWMWSAFLVQLTTLFGGVYTLNQICDVESDRLNRKLHFLPEGMISISAAWRFTIALDATSLALAAVFGWAYLAFSFAIVVLGILYSVGRKPWKNRPWLGLLANCLGHGSIVYMLGFLLTDCPIEEGWRGALAYALAVGAVFLATTVPDRLGDTVTGKTTPAVRWGTKATLLLAIVLVFSAAALAFSVHDELLFWAAAASLPFFVLALVVPTRATLAAKAAVGLLSLAAVAVYPLYLALLVSGFMATRLFFRWRFGTVYPTFV